ncbi:MAG TPA: PEGA domain-containing protein [Polyangiaceae bacterium]
MKRLALLGVLLFACNPPQPPGQLPTVSLRMSGAPADAVVVIDDEAVGTLELVMAHGVALPVGVHHITVKAEGYFPWDKEVEAKEGEAPIRLEAKLTPVPD